ncbi:MAG: TolC family protein [Acidobacteria bacterium]|nr:TolC family protein [Acidobacteriota bacterium]
MNLPKAALVLLAVGALVASAPAALAQEAGAEPLRLSLGEAVAQAIERNLDLKVERLNPPQVEQSITLAESFFDPTFNATAGYSRDKQEPKSAFGALSTDGWDVGAEWVNPLSWGGNYSVEFGYTETVQDFPPLSTVRFGLVPDYYQGSLVFTYNQPFLRNFGLSINRTAIEQAKNNLAISEQQLVTGLLSTVNLVEQAYWNLAGARRQIEVAKSSLALAEDLLRQTKIKVEVGTVAPIEVTTAEAEVAARLEAVITNTGLVGNLEDQLRQYMNVPRESPLWSREIVPTDQLAFQRPALDVETLIETAMENRPELAIADLQKQNLELEERYRQNQLKPDLSAQFSYGMFGNNFDPYSVKVFEPVIKIGYCSPGSPELCGTDDVLPGTLDLKEYNSRGELFKELVDNDFNSWRIGVLLSIPIGNRAAESQYTRTKIALDQQQLSIDAERERIRVQVRQAVRDIETASEQIAAARSNVALQKKKVEAGVVQTQNDLRDAETRENLAVVTYNKSTSFLARVTGTLLKDRGIDVEQAKQGTETAR